MKRFFILFMSMSVMALASCVSVAGMRLSGETDEKVFKVDTGYSVLEVSGSVDILYSAEADNVVVTADSKVLPCVCVEDDKGVLKIYVQRKDRKFWRGNQGKVYVVVPASPSIGKIDISGASDFESDAVITARSLDVKVSGASDFIADMEVESSLEMSVSGASDVRSSVSACGLTVDAGGASDVVLSGRADRFSASVSGASSLSSGKAYVETETFSCSVSGASECYVKCNGTAEGKASGASTVVMYGDGKSRISSSGASSVHYRQE